MEWQRAATETKVFRISNSSGIDGFKFNERELEAISKNKLNPPGISVIRANNAEESLQIWNEAFPNKKINMSSIKESTADEIRNVGFDVIHNPSKGKLGNAHARLIHPDGVDAFKNNLEKITNAFHQVH